MWALILYVSYILTRQYIYTWAFTLNELKILVLALQKPILFILQPHFTKYSTSIVLFWREPYFRPYIFMRFLLWSVTFICTAFSPYLGKRISFLSLLLHQRWKLYRWQTECIVGTLKADVIIKIIIKNFIWY